MITITSYANCFNVVNSLDSTDKDFSFNNLTTEYIGDSVYIRGIIRKKPFVDSHSIDGYDQVIIIPLTKYSDIVNGGTGIAFATLSGLKSFLRENIFKGPGSGGGGTGGDASAAKQDTGNASLASIDGKIPAKGAATIANSTPVNIASDQIVPVSVSSLPAGLSTSAKQDTGNTSLSSIDTKLTKGQQTKAQSISVVQASDSDPSTGSKQDTGNTSLSSLDGKLPAKGAAATANSTPVNIASDQVVPVSVSSLPAGLATSVKQDTGNTSLASIDTKLNKGQGTKAQSLSVVIASDSDPSTSAKQDIGNTSVASIDTKLNKGQGTKAQSLSIVPASDSDPATGTKQDTGNASLSTIATNTPALVGGSVPVTVTNSNTNPATGTRQDTQIAAAGAPSDAAATSDTATASQIALTKRLLTKIPALGQAAMAASQPVVIASDQSVLPVNTLNPFIPFATSAGQTSGDVFYQGLVGNAKVFYFQAMNTATGSIVVQFSNDGILWTPNMPVLRIEDGNISTGQSPLSGYMYKVAIGGVYVKIFVGSSLSVSTTINLQGSYVDRNSDTINAVTTTLLTASTIAIGGVYPNPIVAVGSYTIPYKLIASAGTNSTLVKNSAANIGGIELCNTAASVRYFKLFNLATAPVVGTTVPIKTIMIPAGQSVIIPFPLGLRLTAGLSFSLTTGYADADSGALTAGDVIVNMIYN